MGRKPRRNRSNRKEPKKPITDPTARQILDKAKLQRKEQAAIFQDLLERHKGDIPVYALIRHRGDRLQAVTAL
jgi:hypothetical protein